MYIRVCNHGAYLANCYFESRSFTYAFQPFKYETDLFPVLQCSRIEIPYDSIWNRLECKALVFIAIYKTIFIEEYPTELLNTCYVLKGSILNPTWSQIRC